MPRCNERSSYFDLSLLEATIGYQLFDPEPPYQRFHFWGEIVPFRQQSLYNAVPTPYLAECVVELHQPDACFAPVRETSVLFSKTETHLVLPDGLRRTPPPNEHAREREHARRAPA